MSRPLWLSDPGDHLDAAGLAVCGGGGAGGKRRVGAVRRLRIAWEIVRQLWPLLPAMAAWWLILGLLAAAEML